MSENLGFSAVLVVNSGKKGTVREEYGVAESLRLQLLTIQNQNPAPKELIIVANGQLSPSQIDEITYFINQKNLPFEVKIKNPNWTSIRSNEEAMSYGADFSCFNNCVAIQDNINLSEAYFQRHQENIRSSSIENPFIAENDGYPLPVAAIENNRDPLYKNVMHGGKTVPFSALLSANNTASPDQINQALLSILHQTTPPEEVVFVCDGPMTQEQMKVLIAFQEASDLGTLPFRFVLVKPEWEHSRKLAAALNEGLKHCSSPWVARMDCDDVCLPDRFETQYNALLAAEQRGDPLDMICSSVNYFDETPDETHATIIMPENHAALFERFRFLHAIYHPTTVFKKDVVMDLGGYDETFDKAQDFNLWQRMLEKDCRFGAVQKPLLNFRSTQEQAERRIDSWSFFLRCFKRAFHNGWLSRSEYKECTSEHNSRVNGFKSWEERKRQRSARFGMDWQSEPVHPAVLANQRIDPQNPMAWTAPSDQKRLSATNSWFPHAQVA